MQADSRFKIIELKKKVQKVLIWQPRHKTGISWDVALLDSTEEIFYVSCPVYCAEYNIYKPYITLTWHIRREYQFE